MAGRRWPVGLEPPGRGQKITRWVFGKHPAFNRAAFQMHVGLTGRQFLAGSRADHLFDEVDAGDKFGHRMLDLQPCVHFEEIEILVFANYKFDRAGRIVVDRLCQRNRPFAQLAARFLVDERRGSFFDYFLMAALEGTFAFAKMDDVSALVTQYLYFDVARIGDKFFDEDPAFAESGFCFRPRARKIFRDLLARGDDTHPPAAAAGRGLDHHRIADGIGDLRSLRYVVNDAGESRHGRDTNRLSEFLRFDFVAHRRDGCRVRADEGNVACVQCARERRPLRQKPVARMHRLRPRRLAGRDNVFDDEIAFRRRRRTDPHGLFRHIHMRRILVGIGINGDGRNSHSPRRRNHPAGNLATVRDEDFFEHPRPRNSGTQIEACHHGHLTASACRRARWARPSCKIRGQELERRTLS